jgi:hypothetical protein
VIAMNKADTKRDYRKGQFPCEITKHKIPAMLSATQRGHILVADNLSHEINFIKAHCA